MYFEIVLLSAKIKIFKAKDMYHLERHFSPLDHIKAKPNQLHLIIISIFYHPYQINCGFNK